ncbi:hypothetical protein EXN66_Car022017 [Channa argus]|uniref:Uncharacterized protein n=1 Tax=Channa argus TaxID=215402 RepID=A0A6G1QUW1_CHAAH|nr:hypothetical protein EXN66_Car022017 [Channa argus]
MSRFGNTAPTLPHALAPIMFPLLKTMQQVQNSPNIEGEEGENKFLGCMITK